MVNVRSCLLAAKCKNIDLYEPILTKYFKKYKFSDENILRFLANVIVESSYLKEPHRENLNYTTVEALKRAFLVFRNGTANPYNYLRNPEKLASLVYANRNGNGGVSTKEGWIYRGGGLIQLTGKSNYKMVSDYLNVDLVSNPEKIIEPEYCVGSAFAFWMTNNINSCDTLYCTRVKINGKAALGFNEVKNIYNLIK